MAERAAYDESVWLPHPVLLGAEEDVDDVVRAVSKIHDGIDELLAAEHPLLARKSTNRAERDRPPRSGGLGTELLQR